MGQSAALRGAVRVERACGRATSADQLLQMVSDELRHFVPFDAAMWFGVDPSTLLATAPARIEGDLDGGYCEPLWYGEFHDHDAMLYRDLARNPVPAATLRACTGGSPMRSKRYREFIAPQGYDDEMRAVFRTGDNTWGMAALYRQRGRTPFSADDVALLSAVSTTVGTALRTRAAAEITPWPASANAPGLLFFDAHDVLISANSEAAHWLGEAYGPAPSNGWVAVLADRSRVDLRLPFPTIPLLVRARAVAAGHGRGPARMRLRDGRGRWLVLHASCMPGTLAGDGGVAVVIEPAKSAEIAPIIIEAYGLTVREREVMRHLARGLSTPEMAAELCLSPHTVRDYIEAIFDKVGVSSRGELVAKLFADHYADPMHETLVHAE